MSNPYFLSWQEVADQITSFLPPSWRSQLPGKVLRRLIIAFALSTEALYALMARVLRLAIPATSEGEWLRAIVSGWNMTTYGGTPATVYVRFRKSSSEAVTIPSGTRIGAVFGQVFVTTQLAVLTDEMESVDVPAICTQPGEAGNINIGEIVTLLSPVPGIVEVFNFNPGFGGQSAESDEAIRARIPQHLEMLHRATIPATEGIALNRDLFPEVRGFVTQRSHSRSGYFRAILSDFSGGDEYRARNWVSEGDGVWFISTALTDIQGLVAAGFPCKRFGVVTRSLDGVERWEPSPFVAQVAEGDWRWSYDSRTRRLYARADGRDLNTLDCTIYAGVVWRVLRELEESWAANGVFCDVLVPFVATGAIALSYRLEADFSQLAVENALRIAVNDYVQSLGLGQAFAPEGLYARLALVQGAGEVLVTEPTQNIDVPPDAVFRLSTPPALTRRSQ